MEQEIGQILIDKGLTVSVAESCTGGLISSKLTDVAGSSSYIKLNFVTYSNEAKTAMLGVEPDLINSHGAVSEEVAEAMAQGVRKASETDVGLGITGIAGPSGGSPEKPVGLVYIGLASEDSCEVYKVNIEPSLPRIEVKQEACRQALRFLKKFIK